MRANLRLVPPREPEPPEPERPLLFWWLYAHPIIFAEVMVLAALRAWARPTEKRKEVRR